MPRGSAKAAYATPVTNVLFTGPTATVTLKGLAGHSVYLAKFNGGSSYVSFAASGGVSSSIAGGFFSEFDSGYSMDSSRSVFSAAAPVSPVSGVPFPSGITRIDHPGAQAMNADPLPLSAVAGPARSVTASASALAPAASYTVGTSTKNFWVANEDDGPYNWFQINAKLISEGTHCYVWVASDNLSESSTANDDNQIRTAQAKSLADVFDEVYPLETGVLGYEYGGDPKYSMTSGGWDGDPKISILIYDISGDYSATQQGGVLGYFWSKDESGTETIYDYDIAYKSNKAEIFYIDSFFTDKYPAEIKSTLIHEFQHMINYNQKTVLKGMETASWYNEMLSLVSEEVFGTAIGLDQSGLPWASRFPAYAYSYDWYDFTDWQNNDDVYVSYANSYAFGSYLLHNYGGIPLLKELEQNAAVDVTSVINAVKANNADLKYDAQVIAQLSRYGEALVFGGTNTPSSVNTFCKAAPGISVGGTVVYLPVTNDISSVENRVAGSYVTYGDTLKLTAQEGYTGVLAFPASFPIGLSTGVTRIYSDDSWQNVTGDFTVRLKRPTNANGTTNTNVVLSLYVR